MSCGFTYDDGAYVLGALSPGERAEYEQHLPACAQCREAVANLAVLPGLLGRLDPDTAAPSVTAPGSIVPRVLATTTQIRRREHRRRVWSRVAATMAAAVVAGAVGFGVHVVEGTTVVVAQSPPAASSIPMTVMRQTAHPVPIEARIGLSPAKSGTWVAMSCWYEDGYEGRWPVRLVVFPRAGGAAEQLGTWMASSGELVKFTSMTHLAQDEIMRVELQTADQTTLLWWTPA